MNISYRERGENCGVFLFDCGFFAWSTDGIETDVLAGFWIFSSMLLQNFQVLRSCLFSIFLPSYKSPDLTLWLV